MESAGSWIPIRGRIEGQLKRRPHCQRAQRHRPQQQHSTREFKSVLSVSVRVMTTLTLASWPRQRAAGRRGLTALDGGRLSDAERSEGDHGRHHHRKQMQTQQQEHPSLSSAAPLAHPTMMVTSQPAPL